MITDTLNLTSIGRPMNGFKVGDRVQVKADPQSAIQAEAFIDTVTHFVPPLIHVSNGAKQGFVGGYYSVDQVTALDLVQLPLFDAA